LRYRKREEGSCEGGAGSEIGVVMMEMMVVFAVMVVVTPEVGGGAVLRESSPVKICQLQSQRVILVIPKVRLRIGSWYLRGSIMSALHFKVIVIYMRLLNMYGIAEVNKFEFHRSWRNYR
jgi:hypothetical protein